MMVAWVKSATLVLTCVLTFTVKGRASACSLPAPAFLPPGTYGVKASLANTIIGNGGVADPEPGKKSASLEVAGYPSPIKVVAILTEAQWKARLRSLILATTGNNAIMSPRQRMQSVGSDSMVQFQVNGDRWWLPSAALMTRHREMLSSRNCP